MNSFVAFEITFCDVENILFKLKPDESFSNDFISDLYDEIDKHSVAQSALCYNEFEDQVNSAYENIGEQITEILNGRK